MRKLFALAVAILMLVSVTSAVVAAGHIPSTSSWTGTLLSAASDGPHSVSPLSHSEQNQSGEDEDCASNNSEVSDEHEGADMDKDNDCDEDESDAAEHQPGADQHQGDNGVRGDNQSSTAGKLDP